MRGIRADNRECHRLAHLADFGHADCLLLGMVFELEAHRVFCRQSFLFPPATRGPNDVAVTSWHPMKRSCCSLS